MPMESKKRALFLDPASYVIVASCCRCHVFFALRDVWLIYSWGVTSVVVGWKDPGMTVSYSISLSIYISPFLLGLLRRALMSRRRLLEMSNQPIISNWVNIVTFKWLSSNRSPLYIALWNQCDFISIISNWLHFCLFMVGPFTWFPLFCFPWVVEK